MKTRKLIAAFFAIFAAGMSFAGTICTCTTSPVAVDTVTIDGNSIVDSLQVSYDAAWIGGDANAMVVIADNGTEVKRTTGAGEFTHTLTGDGRHELTYTTYIGGVAQDEVYTATVFKNWTSNISDVTAKQRHPWNGKVDITYTLTGDVTAGFSPEVEIVLFVTASNRVDGTTYAAAASALSGDTGTAEGAHHVIWDLNAQGIEFVSDDVLFTVAYVPIIRYCVIDLSGGASASSYPVTYVASVPSGGFNTDEYKTTKLVLRLVEPGTFMMGGSYQVTLTKPFYCGVFEVTQKQYELVTGSNPSSYMGDMRPVERVSWNTIRGNSSTYNWPGSANVDSNSFVGRLQACTGLNFDLPTEAQWEYACRAGTTSTYNNDGDTENDLKQLGRYSGDKSDGKGGYMDAHTKVGSYEPNAWGLYDMHGNVCEWCLDWYGNLASGVTDPVGSSSGSYRVLRGGGWYYDADCCTSSHRGNGGPSGVSSYSGFRLVRTLSNTEGERSPEAVAGADRADALCAAEAAPVAIDSRTGVRESDGHETLTYSSLWDGDSSATVTIAQDGVALAEGLTGEGERLWNETSLGMWVLTHTTYTNGVAGAVETATFKVLSSQYWRARAAFEGVGVVEEGADGLNVTVTNDVAYTVELSDDLGEVVLDLNGHSIMGATGSAGIRILNGDETGTHLQIVDSRQTGMAIVSGNPGVKVEADAVEVFISVGVGVTIKGDNGRSSAGIVGNVNVNLGTIIGGNGSAGEMKGGDGGSGVNGDVGRNLGTIVGGNGGWGDLASGGNGGIGVNGSVLTNATDAIISGGGGGGGGEVGGDGGIGVGGDVGVNSGMITGGSGGEGGCESGDGGSGVGGDVGVNSGMITGGSGAGFGNGGNGVKGTVLTNAVGAIITGGTGGYRLDVWETGGAGGSGVIGNVLHNEGTIADGPAGGAAVNIDGDCLYDGNGHDLVITISNMPEWYSLSSATIAGVAVTPVDLGGGRYEVRTTYTAAGTYSPTVRLDATNTDAYYIDTKEFVATMTIAQKNISSATVGTIPSCTYANSAYTPTPTVTDTERGVTLVLNTDYTLSYANNVNAGTATVTVNGIGNYTGSTSKTFTIAKCDISGADVTLDESLTYTGAAQSQSVSSVTVDGLSATFEVSDNSATEAGTYTLTVTGTGNFTGTATKQYVITPKALASSMVASMANVTYTGSTLTPLPVVTDSARGVTLVNGTDYTLSYANNVSAGTATVTVMGKGNYTGSIQKAFTIAKATYDMSGAAWSYSSSFTYDGQSHAVTLGGLPSGVSVASYANNSKTAAGSYTATATLSYDSANYEPPTAPSCAWSIAKRNISDATITLGGGLTYNGELQTQSISSVKAGGLTVTYSTSGNTATAAGTYTLTVTGTGNFTGTATKQYTIARKSISGATVTLGSSLIYTGAAQSQSVSSVIVDGLSATFSVSGNSATAAGTYTLTVTGTGNFTGTATKTFTVAKATYDMRGAVWSYSSPFTYDGTAHSVTLGGLPSGVSVASYANNSKTEAGDYTATATLSYDSANYNAPTAPSCAWAIVKAVVEAPTISSHVFDGSECLAVVEPSALYSVVGNLCDLTTGVYEVELALTDPSNYRWRDADDTILLLTGQVVNLVIADGVTEIGSDAFSGWTELRTVDIPDCVTRIGPGAFEGCTSLLSIDLPDGLVDWGLESLPPAMLNGLTYDAHGLLIVDGWLLDCQDRTLSTLTVPEGVVGIGNYALAGMIDLQVVSLPTTLVHIADSAFRECTYLDDLTLPDSVETIAPYAFADCSYIQNLAPLSAVKTVGDRAFAGCTQLAGVVFGEGLVAIGTEAFSNCWRMASVSLPLSTTNVASTAFKSCTSLTGVTVPTHVGKMSEWFAPVYSQITDVTVPTGETEVRADMFAGCSQLASVSLPEGVTNIAARAFKGCSRLSGTTLPATCEALGEEAFANCSSLAAMVLPESVARIGASVFSGCSSLATLTLSRSLTEIPERAFAGCSSLDSFVVPAAVASLGARFVPYRTTAIYYLGNAPSCAADVYADSRSGLTSYVVQGTMGWDGRPTSRDIPQSWNGRNITTWAANRFDVTFDAAGGRFPHVDAATYACEQVTDTAYALPPFEPVRAGYTFGGYWTAETGGTRITASTRVTLTKAHTLYARWTADAPVTVQFNAVGGTVSPASGEYASGAPYGTLPVPTREHYGFAGWYTDASGGARTTEATEVPGADHELFAHWTPCVYLIRYNTCGGSGYMADQSFTYGTTVTLRANAFSKANHSFAGWAIAEGGEAVYADGRTLTEVAALQNGVINLYAVWSQNRYAVRFDSNGGTGQMDNQTFTAGEAKALSACAYTRTGYAFAGWGMVPGGEAVYSDRQIVSNLTATANATVVLYAIWQQKTVAAPVVTPGDGATFTEDSCTVTITCATEGAAIYYSTDGSTPRPSNRYRYTGPFTIADTTEICAFAVAGDVSSDYTTVTITKTEPVVLTLAGVLDGAAQAVTTGGDADWTPVEDATAVGGSSARSGAIAPEESTWMEMTVSGAGTLSFSWKSDCEKDPRNRYSYDFGAFAVDGNVSNRIDGTTAWQTVTVEIADGGTHVFRWTYSKDDYDEDDYVGEDCIWVDHVVWTPNGASGLTAWLAERNLTADARAANGRTAAECYALGLDPAEATNDFRIVSIEMVDGKPKVEWEPKTNRWTGAEILAVLKGAATLDGEWKAVEGATAAEKAAMRFFKVVVEMP